MSPQATPSDIDTALRLSCAALCAMTRYAEAPSAARAHLAARHLECIEQALPGQASLAAQCGFLAMRWRGWILPRCALH